MHSLFVFRKLHFDFMIFWKIRLKQLFRVMSYCLLALRLAHNPVIAECIFGSETIYFILLLTMWHFVEFFCSRTQEKPHQNKIRFALCFWVLESFIPSKQLSRIMCIDEQSLNPFRMSVISHSAIKISTTDWCMVWKHKSLAMEKSVRLVILGG